MKTPHLYASVFDPKRGAWLPREINVEPDFSARHCIQVSDPDNDDWCFRVTSDQAARLVVRLTDLLGGGK